MRHDLLRDMRCPYCGGAFEPIVLDGDDTQIQWGLLRCRCFEFPVVDGIALLNLAKGYGGPEDELNPYVPLLVASVEYLQKGDVAGLLAWIERQLPLVRPLLSDGDPVSYLHLSAELGLAIAPLVEDYLVDMSRYEVIGAPGKKPRKRKQVTIDRAVELSRLNDYYTTRFFSPRAHALALRMCHLDFGPRTLSLCCGHGVFENFVRALDLGTQVVSVDAQLVNLLVTRRYANPDAVYLLHDVQFPLPFGDGAFDGVFSSTCLPELPAQKTFVEESIRAASPMGWAFFDRIWNLEFQGGVRRIEHLRHYRFAQNFFATLEDYVALFTESAGPSRKVGVDLARDPVAYVEDPGWAFGDDIASRLAQRDSFELSALVVDAEAFAFVEPKLAERLRAEKLTPAPGKQATVDPAHVVDQFCACDVAFLPAHFDA
ncbi:MAG: methyltransferase domain-containing protein [Acidimicrobiales bacterium]|nr:methyltransferase domain-containing protein [Acidimicrobiales bacterium]